MISKYIILLLGVLLASWSCSEARAQTCNTNIPASTPSERFTIASNGTVVDQKTGLMWARCAEGFTGPNCGTGSSTSFTWESAQLRAKNSELGNHRDWRVPNIKELESIVERQCINPALNTDIFPARSNTFYWSSTPSVENSDQAWMIFFGFGAVTTNVRTAGFPLMLVRDGG